MGSQTLLSKLYDVLETGKLNLDDLSPRIKELRLRQDELSKAKLQLEAEKIITGVRHVDDETVKAYAVDLKNLLEEAGIAEAKAFVRSFVKRIDINKKEAVMHYSLPMPRGENAQTIRVLPMVTPGGSKMTFPQ